ncbi:Methyltransferase type 12 [Parafrankia sp. Ea1.12]|nr:Methyltransferase type 12 [Parafrankia sp. Ea1.12]
MSTTHRPATDLGFLLHKHPDKAQRFDTAAGSAHVFYPEATEERCTAALLLEIDPVGLVRNRQAGTAGRRGGEGGADAAQYVDDRTYAASSLLAVAMAAVFSTAMAGRCKARPELAATALPLEIRLPSLPCRAGGADLARRLFEPLGWQVAAVPLPLDPRFPEWGDAPHHDVTLTGTLRLADALTQIYILLPVLDDAKHYYVGRDEIDKLLREGASWLPGHPERQLIARRYLAHRRALATTALTQLAAVDDLAADSLGTGFEPGLVATEAEVAETEVAEAEVAEAEVAEAEVAEAEVAEAEVAEVAEVAEAGEAGAEGTSGEVGETRPPALAELRRRAILASLRASEAHRVADVGCGDGKLVARLLAEPTCTEVIAVDVSHRALELAARRLRIERMPDQVRARLRLIVSSLTYRDSRLTGLDAIVLSEVVEHVDPPRLPALAEVVLGHAQPRLVIVTTPNIEYNVRYEGLPSGALRHRDHRFEWTRDEFATWVGGLVARYPYTARLGGVGVDDPEVGQPTQLAILERLPAGEHRAVGEHRTVGEHPAGTGEGR